ncbi:hypothetical protein GWI33_002448 [Rhynchophorus ferrugineus]|uniref:Uncharacterized protein n=1 Tax=Rhynchophorus ferrugineus TaxID=354439 RepID=A0A834ML09_RHYFE|nr:hypothetical protein GWI33_002448 [Rhynchophorus ferrugineus]
MTMGERSTASQQLPTHPSAKPYLQINLEQKEDSLSETDSKTRMRMEYTFSSSPRALYNNKKMVRGSENCCGAPLLGQSLVLLTKTCLLIDD